MRKVLIGTAAVAIAAMTAAYSLPADAQGRGNGNGNDNKAEQSQQRGNGNGNGNGNAKKADRGPQMQARTRGNGNGNAADRGNRGNDRARTADRGPERVRGNGNGRGNGNAQGQQPSYDDRSDDRRYDRDYYRGDDRYRDNDGPFFSRYDNDGNPGLIDGCPPGLAKKNNGCMPPGQAKKRNGYNDRYDANWFGFDGLRNEARYYDGYMVRYGDNGISGYIPLLGGALSVGQQWPGQFGVSTVPDYYRSYYNLGPSYRYYDDTLYRLDPQTSAITSIAALITGDDITVGQPMPSGYDVYNVPMSYRDRYYDRPDAYYRYSDGYVYQVDPETRLVAAAIELLI